MPSSRTTSIFRAWALAFLTAIVVLACGPDPAAAQGAIDGYANYDSLAAQLKALDESPWVNLSSLGKTSGGRDVFLITIAAGEPESKPAILIVGNVEAAHLVGSELALRVAQQIAGPKTDAEATKKLLERFTFYILPRPNPDASEHFFRRPSIERAGNERPIDDDRDGQVDEDPPQDLNGDGLITMMRVEVDSGTYLPHPAEPRVMILADVHKNERGRYTLYSEGRDDDGDEQFNEDPPGGVSFNRNFPHRYAYFEPLSGPHQVSEIETRAVADFAFAHPNIALVLTFSPEDNLLEPWKPSQGEPGRMRTSVDRADAEHLNYLAEQYRDILGAKDAPKSPAGAGSFSEWAYYQYGRWSLAARGWWIPKTNGKDQPVAEPGPAPEPTEKDAAKPAAPAKRGAGKTEEKDQRGVEEINALAWFKREGIDGFVDWKAIEHPDFPGKKVEVGGFKPYLRFNPPARELDPLAEKHFRFLTRLTEWMPRVEISSTKVEALGGGVFRVTAGVLSTGFLPTMSAMGRTSGEAYPLYIKIELPEGVKLLTGSGRARLEVLSGNGGKAQHTWLVLSAGPGEKRVSLTVGSPSVSGQTKIVELK